MFIFVYLLKRIIVLLETKLKIVVLHFKLCCLIIYSIHPIATKLLSCIIFRKSNRTRHFSFLATTKIPNFNYVLSFLLRKLFTIRILSFVITSRFCHLCQNNYIYDDITIWILRLIRFDLCRWLEVVVHTTYKDSESNNINILKNRCNRPKLNRDRYRL